MGTAIVPFGSTAPLRSRFGVRIRKVYGADPRVREHRANMFRSGVLPVKEPGARVAAKWGLGVCGVLLLFSLPAASSGGGGAAGWVVILLAGIGAATAVLLRKSDVQLPAANPYDFDQMLAHFTAASEPEALKRLSYDLGEDVYVKEEFGSSDFGTIPEAVSMPHGLALDPFERAYTVLAGQTPEGHLCYRWGFNYRHHVFANRRGLAYVCTEWDFIEDRFTADGKFPPPRVIEMNQWTWRTIENLKVGEYSFEIQTTGANRVDLPYIGRPRPWHAKEPGAYDWYYNTPAAQRQRGAGRPPGGVVGAGQTSPVDDPHLREFLQEQIRQRREAAIRFVNTVNSLRNEWEDRQ